MKVQLVFDDAEIEPNGYVLRDTSWQEYCPMPEMIRQSDSAGQKAGEPGLLRTQQDASQRRGDDVHREVRPIKGLYRRLERHWIFHAVGRQVVTETSARSAERSHRRPAAGPCLPRNGPHTDRASISLASPQSRVQGTPRIGLTRP